MMNNEEMKTNPAHSYDDAFPALPTGISDRSNVKRVKAQTGCVFMPPISFLNQIRNMQINSSEVTQVFSIPAEECKYDHNDKFGEGESLRTCAQISKETGASIEISTSKDKSLTFLIRGKSKNVIEAKRKVLTNFQTQANVSISILKEHHRCILGKSGQRLKELEKNTGTKITIPNVHDSSDKITVIGTRESIERAIHEIKVISDEQSKKAFERIKVEKPYHPFITGANNEKLNQLMTETNTRINIPPPFVDNDEITIAGEKEGVENAKNRILQIYDNMKKTCQQISVQVPKWQHKYVIGHKRSTIAEILHDTGVSVVVPPADQLDESITLRGPYELLGEALKYLHNKAQSMQCADINAPSRIHRLIIGKKGANIRELQDMYKQCHVEFTDDKIRVEGPPDSIDELKKKLEDRVKYYLNEYSVVELEVNPEYFKHIIGKNGVNVNRLKNNNDVSISIAETDNSNSIKIEGSKENVAQVKRELEEQIKKLENERERDIIINQTLHRIFTANKREKLKELQDKFRVLILFPNSNDNSDVVKIKGQKGDVDCCYKYLSELVKDLNENNFTVKVPIYKQFHKCIIGRGGNNIKKIRDETGTKIELPGENDESDTITIIGKKENVEEAKERILKIQNEMANIVNDEVNIPFKLHSSFFGANAKLLQAIKDDCGGVQIKFPPPESRSDKIILRGPPEDIAKAKQQLLDVAAEKQQSSYTIEVRAKPEHHKFLIGKSGLRIKKIRETTGTRIIFPNGDDDKEIITIIGKKESVEKAKEELETIIKQICNTIEQYVQVNPKYHKHFISNRGELIHKISEECDGVIISFPRNTNHDDSKVTIKGNPDGVREAIKKIENVVQDLENKFEDEVQVAPKYHKHFVSRKGEVLQNIIYECGGFDHVSISFPRTDIKDSRVQLKGIKESVHLAKNKILRIVKDLEEQITIEVFISNKDHRNLLRSRKYRTVDDIRRENNVKIAFPDRIDASHQNGQTQINGDINSDDKEVVKPCDIVHITGKPENCEAAKKALLEIVPIELELNIPYSFHGSIIGQKGVLIQEIIKMYDVQVEVPRSESKSDIITIRGRPECAENAKNWILKKKREIEESREDWELKNYEDTLAVPLEYHPQIIGRGGEVINKIRKDHKVQISLPKKNDSGGIITIIGYQKDVEAAKADIENIVDRLKSRYREEVTIDRRVHSRMIGKKGSQVRRIMEDFEVEIRFPRDNDPNQNIVVISGDEDKVLECKDHLLYLEEEFIQDVHEDERASADLDGNGNTRNNRNEAGFVVKGAPWDQKAPDTTSISEFPSFGEVDNSKSFAQLGTKSKPVWGPRR